MKKLQYWTLQLVIDDTLTHIHYYAGNSTSPSLFCLHLSFAQGCNPINLWEHLSYGGMTDSIKFGLQ
jgi:hypothetical protein